MRIASLRRVKTKDRYFHETAGQRQDSELSYTEEGGDRKNLGPKTWQGTRVKEYVKRRGSGGGGQQKICHICWNTKRGRGMSPEKKEDKKDYCATRLSEVVCFRGWKLFEVGSRETPEKKEVAECQGGEEKLQKTARSGEKRTREEARLFKALSFRASKGSR